MAGMQPSGRIWLTLATLAALTLPASAQDSSAKDSEAELDAAPRISQAEFKKLLEENRVLVIDVRDSNEYEQGHIPGAVSMPVQTIEQNAAALQMVGQPIVTYCS
jgi:predicted sulfurtransferase